MIEKTRDEVQSNIDSLRGTAREFELQLQSWAPPGISKIVILALIAATTHRSQTWKEARVPWIKAGYTPECVQYFT